MKEAHINQKKGQAKSEILKTKEKHLKKKLKIFANVKRDLYSVGTTR